jgi:hypothetical protein
MTFWQFFNESPVVGLIFATAAIIGIYASLSAILDLLAIGVRAKYAGCSCQPCERPHADDSDDADEAEEATGESTDAGGDQ